MRYKVNKNETRAAYLQLYGQLRDDIVNEYYSCGSRMPSKRTLSEEAGTSVITVEHAYALLAEEGYIEPRQRSGYYVCYRGVDTLGGVFPESSGEEPEIRPQEGDRSEAFPFSVFARTMRKVLTNRAEDILEPSLNSGTPELRGAISAYLARSRGIIVQPDQILIGAGAEYLYGLAVQMIGRSCLYALEDPSYEKIRQVYEANGVRCEMLKLASDGIRSTELARTSAGVLHVTPFNSYPSGITASASRRHEYIRWAKERKALIIEDDYDSEFSELTKAEDTLFSLEPRRTVLYINTFSRTIAPSMRMGYMVLPSERCEELREKIAFYTCTVPVFEQYVLAEFINEGHFERHINRVRRRRRQESRSV
ncbi:MAG: PLP-dependent aminotransferase family protein [Eubacterium sp.]|nr:PLP-dependent aminotransferase family protein [Eubacterium sp.]